MPEHTPGPWVARNDGEGHDPAVHSSRWFIDTEAVGDLFAHGLSEADARLIAAAPEMRKALVRLDSAVSWCLARHSSLNSDDNERELNEAIIEVRNLLSKVENRGSTA